MQWKCAARVSKQLLLLPVALGMMLVSFGLWFVNRKHGIRWKWTPVFCGGCFWGGPLGWCLPEGSLFVCPRCGEDV